MVKAECDNCGKDEVDDYIYCGDCYESLAKEVDGLKNDLENTYEEIKNLEFNLDEANKRIKALENAE